MWRRNMCRLNQHPVANLLKNASSVLHLASVIINLNHEKQFTLKKKFDAIFGFETYLAFSSTFTWDNLKKIKSGHITENLFVVKTQVFTFNEFNEQ